MSKCATCGQKIKKKSSKNSSVNSNTNTQNSTQNTLFGNTKKDFVVGAVIGLAATFILTNENAQKAVLKGFAKLSSLFEMGVEELKERYEDAKAEVNA